MSRRNFIQRQRGFFKYGDPTPTPQNITGTLYSAFTSVLIAAGGIVTNILTVDGDSTTQGDKVINGTSNVNANGNYKADLSVTGNVTVGGLPLSFIPVGNIMEYAGTTAPAKWLLCDGAAYSTILYPSLFAEIGYQYGGAAATFNVPDLRGRVPISADAGAGRITVNGGFTDTDGVEEVILTEPQLGVHNHGAIVATSPAAHTHTVTGTGVTTSDGAHSMSFSGVRGSHYHTYGYLRPSQGLNAGVALASVSGVLAITGFQPGPIPRVLPPPPIPPSTSGVTGFSGFSGMTANAANDGVHSHTVNTTTSTTLGGNHSHTFTTTFLGLPTDPHNNIQAYQVTNFIIKAEE